MGLRRFLQRMLPAPHVLREHRHLRVLGSILHDPEIFHLTRHSTAGGVAAGLFCAFAPFPGHMLMAALAAILMRVNLPVAVVMTWVTNPVTVPPLFYLAYRTGTFLLGRHPQPVIFEWSLEWFTTVFAGIWPSLVIGCLLFAVVSAMVGYATVILCWRLAVIRKMRQRRRNASRK